MIKVFRNFRNDFFPVFFFRSLVRPIKNFDVNRNEYLCPICSRLSNSVLPLVPSVSQFLPSCKAAAGQSFYAWADKARKLALSKTVEDVSDAGGSASSSSRTSSRKASAATTASPLPRMVLGRRGSSTGVAHAANTRFGGGVPAVSSPAAAPEGSRQPRLNQPVPVMLGNMASTFTLNLLSVRAFFFQKSIFFFTTNLFLL